jgi:anti-anti-sigma regulatory factor
VKQEELKMNLSVDQIGDLSVIECEGRMMGSEAAFKFRDVVTSRKDARVIVVDLSEVWAVGGAALGILVFLQRWARHHNIQFKLFNPSKFVRARLDLVSPLSHFDIATLDEMMALLGQADSRYAIAA